VTGKSLSRRFGAYDVRLYLSADAAIAAGELDSKYPRLGMPPHRLDWLDATGDGKGWWIAVRDLQQHPVAGFAVTVLPTRALSGHRFLRLERLRFAPDPGPAEAAVQCLVNFARRDGRTLSVAIETFYADVAEKDRARAVLERAGFRPARLSRIYTHTLRIDLTREPEELLASFHATARRHIRAVGKRPVEIKLVQDLTLVARLGEILSETFDRTAGAAAREPWRALIEYSRAHPDRARLVCLVRTDREGPEALVAFALGLNHGDHVEYSVAGSTRPPDLRMPFGYALAWDLMGWAKTAGAQWFDFGGIAADSTTDDERQGIHDFKRTFGNNVIEVSETWSCELRPVRGAWVRAVSGLTGRLRGFVRPRSHASRKENEPPG
jgi:hypothetical protein